MPKNENVTLVKIPSHSTFSSDDSFRLSNMVIVTNTHNQNTLKNVVTNAVKPAMITDCNQSKRIQCFRGLDST